MPGACHGNGECESPTSGVSGAQLCGPAAHILSPQPRRLVGERRGWRAAGSQGGRLPPVQPCPAAWRSWPVPKGSTRSFTTTAGEGQRRWASGGWSCPLLSAASPAACGAGWAQVPDERARPRGPRPHPHDRVGGCTPVLGTAPAGRVTRRGARHPRARRRQLQDTPFT